MECNAPVFNSDTNFVTIQDTRKVASIEEFKNKKFRYQMSEYSVEIERLITVYREMIYGRAGRD